jgi:hypothetical protein
VAAEIEKASGRSHDMLEDYKRILMATREVASNRGVPSKELDLEMIVAAFHAATDVDIEFCRKHVLESVKIGFFLPLIPRSNLVEDPMRATAALIARLLFAKALEMQLDTIAFAKAVIASAYADMARTSVATAREAVDLVADSIFFEIRMEAELKSGRRLGSRP